MINLGMIVCLLAAFNACYATQFSFEGYNLVRMIPQTSNHLEILKNLENQPGYDAWTNIKGLNKTVTAAMPKDFFLRYKRLFDSANLPFEVLSSNLQELIDQQQRSMKSRDSSIVGRFARYSEILGYIEEITENNKDLASYYSLGKTYEKREMRVLVLKTETSKRSIWLDCGIHAREWASPASCIWFIDRLIRDYRENDPVAVDLLNYYEFHILPVYNADGYEYTFTTSRLWRKNRRPNRNSACVGTDLNRNFDIQWMVAGSSQDPCTEIYAGPAPDSEIENINLQQGLLNKKGQWDSYITLHSYSAYWMVPWAYTEDLPEDYLETLEASKVGAEALRKVNGLRFVVGSTARVIYTSSGGTIDWAKAVAGIKYTIALELRPTANSRNGFLLPENQVPLAGEETYQGLKAYINVIKSQSSKLGSRNN